MAFGLLTGERGERPDGQPGDRSAGEDFHHAGARRCGIATRRIPSTVSAALLRPMFVSPLRDGGLTLRSPLFRFEVAEHGFGARVPMGEGSDIGARGADTIQFCSASAVANTR